MHSLGKTLLAFALLHFVLQCQTCLSFQVSLDFLLLHSNTLWWKGLFILLVLIVEGLVGHHRTIPLQLLWHQWLGHSLGLLWLLNKHIVTMDYCSLIRVFSWNLFIKYRKKWLGCAAVRMEVYWEIFQSMSLSLEWDLTPSGSSNSQNNPDSLSPGRTGKEQGTLSRALFPLLKAPCDSLM